MTPNDMDAFPEELSPQQVEEWLRKNPGSVALDVREEFELADGILPGALHLPLSRVPEVTESMSHPDQPLILYCQHGIRSLQATRYLRQQGWGRATSMSGGFVEWISNGHPIQIPETASELDDEQRERYASQLVLPEFGMTGQQRLLKSRVMIVGVGGLGCPAAMYLASGGVGTLRLVDDDVVSRSNLPRQIIYKSRDVGELKVPLAASQLRAMNPGVTVEEHVLRLDTSNVMDLIEDVDVIVDASDNFPTRFLVSDAARNRGIPVVHGSVHRFEGMVTVFDPQKGGPCLRCLHPTVPDPDLCQGCAETGVLGVLPGMVGMYQSTEVLKILAQMGDPLLGRLLTIDAIGGTSREYRLNKAQDCVCNH